VLVAGVAAAGVRWRPVQQPAHETAAACSLAQGGPAATPAASRLGETRRYDARIESRVSLSPGQPQGAGDGPRSFVQEVSGPLAELALNPSGSIALVAVPGAVVTIAGQRQPAIESALAKGLVVQRDARGRVSRVRLPRSAGTANGALRSLAMLVEWTAPDGEARAWEASEATPQGEAAVRYEIGDDAADGAPFTRRIERLTRPARDRSVLGLVPSESATLRGRVDRAAARVVSLNGEIAAEYSSPTKAVVASGRTTVTLTGTGVDRDPAAALAAIARLDAEYADWTDLADTPEPDAADARASAAEMFGAGRSLDELLRALDSGDDVERARAQVALAFYVEAHAGTAARLGREITQAPREDRRGRTLLGVLARAGGPEAQRAVVDLVKEWRDTPRVVDALPLLGQVEHPTRETEDFLRGLQADPAAKGIGATVDTTLGALASRLQGSEPGRADAIAERFEERLKASSDPGQQQESLMALGNTRSERILDVAPGLLASDDADVRRAAVFALGRAPDEEGTQALLEKAANDDPDGRVRAAARRALSRHGG
jgi:HEAT repeat protein